MDPVNDDPVLLFNLDEQSMMHLTRVPPQRQDIRGIIRRDLDAVLANNQMELMVRPGASTL